MMNNSHPPTVNEFYDGSRLLWPLVDLTRQPIDVVNFIASQVLAFAIAFVYREYFGPDKTSPAMRHWIQILIGIPLTYFCFGRQIIHLFAQSLMCFLLLRFLDPGLMEKAVLVVSVGYLCICHFYRTVYDYGGYTLDITGPLMINTQRLSSLAFGVRDGYQLVQNSLSPKMKQQAVRKFPTVLEFTSYVFAFHGMMLGPFCFYNDYIAFIQGTNFKTPQVQKHKNEYSDLQNSEPLQNDNHKPDESGFKETRHPPGFKRALHRKVLTTVVFGISTLFILPYFPKTILTGQEFVEHGFLYKMFLIIFYCSLQRQKYYFAWKLGESVNVNAGLGFRGYDDHGEPCWDLVDNADIWKVEFSTSLKELIDNWNRTTTYWLRYVVYERVNRLNTLAVIITSSVWHGFYPGYYLTFFTGGILTHAARLMRRNIRPFFLTTRPMKFLYDAITFLFTRIAVAYLGFPFLVLELWPIWTIYRALYFWMHIGAIVLAVAIMATKSMPRNKQK